MLNRLHTWISEVQLDSNGKFTPACLMNFKGRIISFDNWLRERNFVQLELNTLHPFRYCFVLNSSHVATPLVGVTRIYFIYLICGISPSTRNCLCVCAEDDAFVNYLLLYLSMISLAIFLNKLLLLLAIMTPNFISAHHICFLI